MDLLALAIDAARAAGALLREEFRRGPRGKDATADVDVEAEHLIRSRLLATGFGYRGEETGLAPGGPFVWIVDPNDGTRDYLRGRRGSSVSIGLVKDGRPVLGVVYSPTAPDDDGDLVAWQEGGPSPRRASPPPVVLVSTGAERRAASHLERLRPWRMMPTPSIAYRLALVAAGDASAALGLRGPRDWDYAAGHALLLGAGDVLFDRRGNPVRYALDGESRANDVVGAGESVARDLLARDWEHVITGKPEDPPFVRLEPGRTISDAARLRRAQGCLLGQVVGDALGGHVELSPRVVRDLEDGGPWGLIAGQPTDDSELALALARSIVAENGYRAEIASAWYRGWLESRPFDVPAEMRKPDPESLSDGALRRASPLGILGSPEAARADAAITHPHPSCVDACGAYAAAISRAIDTGDRNAAIAEARESPPLRDVLHRLRTFATFEEIVVGTVAAGGSGAIAGALAGAVLGRDAIPLRWRSMALTCRPLAGLPNVRNPRPRLYWPVDLLEIAERLLLLRLPGS